MGTGLLQWTDPDNQVSPVTFRNTTNITSLENYPISFLSFLLAFVSGNQTAVCSQATLNTPVTPSINGDSIRCSDAMPMSQPVTSTIIVRGEIQLIRRECFTCLFVDPPGSPLDLEFTAINTHSLLLNWSPPQENSTCITSYIIEINTTQVLYTTENMTSLLISNRSLGSVYLFSVMGRDSGNRTGNKSLPLKVIWNGKKVKYLVIIY